MPAAKKSAAYEKGLREGRADKNKPSIEIEINPEGEEEEEMGTEEIDAVKPHSRKRSAKNAKHTTPAADGYGLKQPMDAECGCEGKGRKGKASCDGNCGGYGKKMDRNDALSPQEYLAACDLGIQHRSRAYIRARLDAAERLDLKCGGGSISEGEKCTKGAAQKVQPKAGQRKGLTGKQLLAVGLAVGGGYLAVKSGKAALKDINEIGSGVKGLMERKAKLKAIRAQNKKMGLEGEGENAFTRFLDRTAPDKRRQTLNRAFRKPSAKRPPRRDSVYASGFTTDLDQLAV